MKRLNHFLAATAAVLAAASGGSATTVFHQLASFEDGVPTSFDPQNGAILYRAAHVEERDLLGHPDHFGHARGECVVVVTIGHGSSAGECVERS